MRDSLAEAMAAIDAFDQEMNGAAGAAEPGEEFDDPSQLANLMIWRPRISRSHGVLWISLRAWRSVAKDPIGKLSAAKDSNDPVWIESMAADMLAVMRMLRPALTARPVLCAPSARHSAFIGVEHFASIAAAKVAESLGLESRKLFEPTPAKYRGHHPRREKDPPKLAGAPPADVIMIDDLATSGATMLRHVECLEEAGARVLPICWIYGNVKA